MVAMCTASLTIDAAVGTGSRSHNLWNVFPYVSLSISTAISQPVQPPRKLDEADANGMLSWQGSGGFSVDASVRIEGDDRAGIERLIRYCARPPFALERLHAPAGIGSLASITTTASSIGSHVRHRTVAPC